MQKQVCYTTFPFILSRKDFLHSRFQKIFFFCMFPSSAQLKFCTSRDKKQVELLVGLVYSHEKMCTLSA